MPATFTACRSSPSSHRSPSRPAESRDQPLDKNEDNDGYTDFDDCDDNDPQINPRASRSATTSTTTARPDRRGRSGTRSRHPGRVVHRCRRRWIRRSNHPTVAFGTSAPCSMPKTATTPTRPSTPRAQICDGTDNDCDGQTDSGDDNVDLSDPPGTPTAMATGTAFPAPAPTPATNPRATPTTPTLRRRQRTYPGATEQCDGQDNDCNGLDDAAMRASRNETDNDGDGMVECAGDCGDDDPAVYTGAAGIATAGQRLQ